MEPISRNTAIERITMTGLTSVNASPCLERRTKKPISPDSGCGLRKRISGRAYVQSFALFLGEEGTFASVDRKFPAKRRKGAPSQSNLVHFAALSLVRTRMELKDMSWHQACKCCYVQIGIGEGNG